MGEEMSEMPDYLYINKDDEGFHAFSIGFKDKFIRNDLHQSALDENERLREAVRDLAKELDMQLNEYGGDEGISLVLSKHADLIEQLGTKDRENGKNNSDRKTI